MAYQQTTPINDQASDYAGYCLRFAQQVFSTKPYGYESAWIAWEATSVKHYDRNFPNDVVTPVWFSHIGNYDGTGNKNWGHVVAYFPGRGFLSSPGSANSPGRQWFTTIEQIESYFRCTHVGWSEDINDLTVMVGAPEPAPAPAPAPGGTYYTVVPGDNLWNIAVTYYGDGTRYPEIATANAIPDPNLIFPGQVLLIPGV